MWSTNHCVGITGKLTKSIFLGHVPELQNQNFRGGAWESELLIRSPGNNPDAHQSLRTNDQDTEVERMQQVLLHHIFEYKAQTDFIPRLSTHKK